MYGWVGQYRGRVSAVQVRATGGLKLQIRRSEENSQRVNRAQFRFGAPRSQIRADDRKEPGIVFQLGIAPRRIDVLTMIDRVDVAEA